MKSIDQRPPICHFRRPCTYKNKIWMKLFAKDAVNVGNTTGIIEPLHKILSVVYSWGAIKMFLAKIAISENNNNHRKW